MQHRFRESPLSCNLQRKYREVDDDAFVAVDANWPWQMQMARPKFTSNWSMFKSDMSKIMSNRSEWVQHSSSVKSVVARL